MRGVAAPISITDVVAGRPRAHGKFIYVGSEKLYVRGVTYGTFDPGVNGNPYRDPDVVERDFAMVAASGANAVRTYTVPPGWLLDHAHRHGLRVMIGLPWEQHITYLEDRRRANSIVEQVRTGVRSCAGHPAVLCYAVGNEIPAGIVRWHGPRRTEEFLGRLYEVAKEEDPEGLVTYVNYPSTEYLDLPWFDLVCFNVYLESQPDLEAYLARLHNIGGERPLLMGELGFDSRRDGQDVQARTLDWQVRTAFSSGCAGAFVFSWTDEWHRGGQAIEDWDFGLTRRDRSPKPALEAVRLAFDQVPLPRDACWPRISVVICSYNGARVIRDCLEHLRCVEYPDFEVIVVDDGSTDQTAAIAAEYDVKLISTENQGLSSARNVGLHAADGDIVAYIDDDAYPDPHWLSFLANTFIRTSHAGVGGPNIPPSGDGLVADCVASAPGGPVHVLLSDLQAEHIPGCNMAFRKDNLLAIGGFDPQFRAAGDDVDVCWRLQESGETLGFSPSATVWHRRRGSVAAYWKQQQGYGKAEALLERKWPEKYNPLGHVSWNGRLYGNGLTRALVPKRGRIYHGTWGSAPFQSVYEPATGLIRSLPLMPEWYVLIVALAALSLLSPLWSPLSAALPLFVAAVGAPLFQSVMSGARARTPSTCRSPAEKFRFRALTAFLHLIQPLARLRGRLTLGLTPWRQRQAQRSTLSWPRPINIWSETWREPRDWLRSAEAVLRGHGLVVRRGGDFDRWDLDVRLGALGGVRILTVVEEHGAGKQFAKFRTCPMLSPGGVFTVVLLAILATGAALGQAWLVAGLAAAAALILALRMFQQCAGALAMVVGLLQELHVGRQ